MSIQLPTDTILSQIIKFHNNKNFSAKQTQDQSWLFVQKHSPSMLAQVLQIYFNSHNSVHVEVELFVLIWKEH